MSKNNFKPDHFVRVNDAKHYNGDLEIKVGEIHLVLAVEDDNLLINVAPNRNRWYHISRFAPNGGE